MSRALPLPEFVTSRRHRVTAGVGAGVIAVLVAAAATMTPSTGTPPAATPAAAGSDLVRAVSTGSVGDGPAAVPTEVGAVVGTPVTAAPPASASSPQPSGPAITALAAQGIPIVALQAYQKAAALQAAERPSCRLGWTLVAAIGAIESGHGTHAGARLYADGQDLPHVIGPVLDGTNGNALIPDTDKGAYDGDPVYDHAVGPMQFIPSTWALRGRDGNGDGVADPFNIFDAAATTGDYLCRYGQDLSTDAGRQIAVFGYNHLDSYVTDVLALDAAYAGRPVTVTSTAPAAPPAPTTSATPPATTGAPSPSAPGGSAPSSSAPTPTTPAPTTSAPSTPDPTPTCPTTSPSPTDPPTTSPSPLPGGCPTPTDPASTSAATPSGSPAATSSALPAASASPTP